MDVERQKMEILMLWIKFVIECISNFQHLELNENVSSMELFNYQISEFIIYNSRNLRIHVL